MFKSSAIRNTKYYLIQYDENNFRLLKNKYQLEKGWELENRFEGWEIFFEDCNKLQNGFNSLLSNEFKKEESLRSSLSRSKSRIRELALCNNFQYFGTLTLNGFLCNRYELDDAQALLKTYLKKIKRNNKDFKYIIITEKHKDGAFHFHGLFSRY